MPSRSSSHDEHWLRRALALARRGEALTSPNPMVGAVLVRAGRVVGEGFHTYDGVRHAEVIALKAAGKAAHGATLYINLEPCCHDGRTGSCTRALVAAGVARVVAAIPDPNPIVAGRGFRQLRAAGIEVGSAPEFVEESRRLNEAFAAWVTSHRPFVTLKSAMTLDGHLVLPAARSRWITSAASRAEVQRMRRASDALLTGIGTVLADNPLLTDRTGLPRRRPLLRVVVDSRLRLSPRSKLVRTAREDVLVFTCASESSARARALRRAGIEVIRLLPRPVIPNALPAPRRRHRDAGRELLLCPHLQTVLRELGRRDILSVLLEAGPTLNQTALHLGLVDKIRFFYAPKLAGTTFADNVQPPTAFRKRTVPRCRLTGVRIEQFGPDFALEAYLRDIYQQS